MLDALAWVALSARECRALGYSRAERSALNGVAWVLLGALVRTAYAGRGNTDRADWATGASAESCGSQSARRLTPRRSSVRASGLFQRSADAGVQVIYDGLECVEERKSVWCNWWVVIPFLL